MLLIYVISNDSEKTYTDSIGVNIACRRSFTIVQDDKGCYCFPFRGLGLKTFPVPLLLPASATWGLM
jgi:hypothetical protein